LKIGNFFLLITAKADIIRILVRFFPHKTGVGMRRREKRVSNSLISCKPYIWLAVFFIPLICILFPPSANGAIIYESATLANEGTDTMTLTSYTLDYTQYLASRFHIDDPVDVTSIGGHLIGDHNTLFGAILSLDSPSSLPTGDPINMSEVVAYGVFGSSEIYPSKDYRLPLSVVLDPGDYAVVFGSDLFGAFGDGGMIYIGQEDLPGASYICWIDSTGWFEPPDSGMRFVVEGTVIPEPSAVLLLSLGGLLLARKRA
jgi:hypothetical protein